MLLLLFSAATYSEVDGVALRAAPRLGEIFGVRIWGLGIGFLFSVLGFRFLGLGFRV
jgi:hypothetical protein